MSGTCLVGDRDFQEILADFKRTVSYQVMSKTIDPMTGDEATTFATGTNKDVIFFLEDNRYLFDKEGLVQVGDAYIMAELTLGIKRYDRVTVDGASYYIENVTRRHILNTAMFDYAVLFKVN